MRRRRTGLARRLTAPTVMLFALGAQNPVKGRLRGDVALLGSASAATIGPGGRLAYSGRCTVSTTSAYSAGASLLGGIGRTASGRASPPTPSSPRQRA